MVPELSIFVSRKADDFDKALEALAAADVNILTFSVDHAAPYTIMRIICSEPTRAYQELLARSFVFDSTQVFALKLANRPGELKRVLDVLHRAEVRIEYGYQTMCEATQEAVVILKTNDIVGAKQVLDEAGIEDLEKLPFEV